MSFWTAVVVIVAILAFAAMKIARYNAEAKRGHAPPIAHDPDPAAERRELEDLRERIKVLERIATDGNTLDARETQRISREIEALRDRQDG
jgi:hypothetical protein